MDNYEKMFVSRLGSLAKFLGQDMDAEVIGLYDRLLAPLGYQKLCEAIDRIAVDLGPGKPFPSIRAIKDAVTGTAAITGEAKAIDDEEARLAASNIMSAVRRYGSRLDTSRVEEHVGPFGWSIVMQRGGWQVICDSVTNDNARNFELDLRELAKALLSRKRRGLEGVTPGSPAVGPRSGDLRGISGDDVAAALPDSIRDRMASEGKP